MVELVEAAALSGRHDEAAAAYRTLAGETSVSGTDWGLGIDARSRALVTSSDDAESCYLEAIELLGRTHMKAELAGPTCSTESGWATPSARPTRVRDCASRRTCWSRSAWRGSPSVPAAACAPLEKRPADANPPPASPGKLTAQESQIARLARDGLSNPEIGARLFISARTVQYHLRKVFAKLGITSRSQLDRVLPDPTNAATSMT